MNELSSLASAWVAGALLGTSFFAGLWWTVRRIVSSERVAFWLFGSMLLRTCVVLAGFHVLLAGDWKRLLAGLTGFFIARVVATRLARVAKRPGPLARRAGDAP